MTSGARTKKSAWYLETIEHITNCVGDEEDLETIISKKWEQEIHSWFQWFETTYPDADGNKHLQLLQESKERVDFRLLFIAFPIETFSLIPILDACYAVDKALCGFSSLSSTRLQKLQTMDKLEYLSSEELTVWWEESLCELDELIKSRESVSVSDTFRVADILTANQTLQNMVYKLGVDCWPSLKEHYKIWQEVPGGVGEIERQVEKRVERLRLAADSLSKSLEHATKREKSETPTTKTEVHAAAESRSREAINEGIRQRIPFTNSTESTPMQSPRPSPGLDTVPFTPLVDSDPEHEAGLTATIAERLPGITAIWERISVICKISKRALGLDSALAFAIHKLTATAVFSTFVLFAGFAAALSTKPTQDSGFIAALSQGLFTILSIYLAALPPLRTRVLDLRYSFWFWFSLFVCGMTCLLSLTFYNRYPAVSTILSCVSGFAQALCTFLLVECVQKAVKAGNIGGVERRHAVRNDRRD
ncbi:hypothetical protein N431DRAFT_365445 [Stipitochalara longipes BDJ]|nr:hypothetical protein N431DRAFT_365445 [Stipitochalara longipes BDJ]